MTVPTQMNCPHSGEGWCLECVSKLNAELEDLKGRLSKEPRVKLVYDSDSGTEIELDHVAVRMFAASFWKTFEEMGGENFVTMEICGHERGPIEVTLRPVWGNKKTPAALIHELREEIERLKELTCHKEESDVRS